MIIGERYPFAFVHIPKTGGSSITKWLAQLEGKSVPNVGARAWQAAFHNHGSMHSGAIDEFGGRFCFCFFRDPIERWQSWWRASQRSLVTGTSPDDFVMDRINGSGRKFMSMAQHEFIRPGYTVFKTTGNGRYQFIVRATAALTIPFADIPVFPHLNKSEGIEVEFSGKVEQAILEHDHVAADFFDDHTSDWGAYSGKAVFPSSGITREEIDAMRWGQ